MTRPDVVLDTHALLWLLQAPNELSETAARAIREAPRKYVSTATVFEIGTKYRIGKLPVVAPLVALGWTAVLQRARLVPLEVTVADAELAANHPSPHRDPWDRLIAAQAALRGLPVISTDSALDAFGAARIW